MLSLLPLTTRVAHLVPSRATGCSEWSLGSYPGTELVPHGLSDSSPGLTPVPFFCAQARFIRNLCQIMLERMITTLPEGRFLLCAGAVNTHISSFWTPVGTPGCSKVAHMVPTGVRWVS